MISFIARSVPFLKICYRCFFFFGISVCFSISISVFVAVFSNANRAIEQHFTNWQAGKLKFSAVTTGKHTRVSTCACIVVLYRIILYILYAVQVPPHTHTDTRTTPREYLLYALSLCMSLSLCVVVATQLHMFLLLIAYVDRLVYLWTVIRHGLRAITIHRHTHIPYIYLSNI